MSFTETLDEAFREGTIMLTMMLIIGLAIMVLKLMTYQTVCPHCNGRGYMIINGKVVNCPHCNPELDDEDDHDSEIDHFLVAELFEEEENDAELSSLESDNGSAD